MECEFLDNEDMIEIDYGFTQVKETKKMANLNIVR